MTQWLNGNFVESAAIDAADRGFLLGDGAFETIYVEHRRCAFLSEHLGRLKLGLGALGIAPPSFVDLGTVVSELCDRNAIGERPSAARITVTRGVGERGLRFSGDAPTLLVTVAPLAAPAADHSRVALSSRTRFAAASTTRFKAIGGYVENMLAFNDARQAGADEALMLNERGRLASAAAANVFLIGRTGIATPPVEEGALPGIVRSILLRRAGEVGAEIIERPVERSELEGAMIFLTNSLIGVRPAILSGESEASSPAGHKDFRALQSCYQNRLREALAGKLA